MLLKNTVGENNPHHKLTAEQVKAIFLECKNGKASRQELADRFGVSLQTVKGIVNKRFWLSVTRDL